MSRSTSPRRRSGAGTAVSAVRVAWGAVLVAAPSRVTTAVAHQDTPTSRTVLQILGFRHLLQGLVSLGAGRRGLEAGAGIDAAHGLSCVAFAAREPRWRSIASLDAAIALGFAVASLAAARSAGVRPRQLAAGTEGARPSAA